MSKDGPKAGRMGFGFQQAKEAGVPYRAERTNAQVNLDAFVRRHPECAGRVKEMRANNRRSDSILDQLREEGLDGRHCLGLARSEEGDWLEFLYDNNRSSLTEKAAWHLGMGSYKYAQMWDLRDGEWVEAESWPDVLQE